MRPRPGADADEGADAMVTLVLVFPLLRTPPDCVREVELYRTWAEGGPFPSQWRTVPKKTPLVVDIRAFNPAQQRFEIRVAPIGGDRESAPQLRWTAARDCPAGG